MTRVFILVITISGVLLASRSARAAGDEVVVVYNKKVPASADVARHYAEVRKVPAEQVLGLDLATDDEITRKQYDETLAQPLSRELEARKLWRIGSVTRPVTNGNDLREVRMPVESKIRYLVLCYGVPLKIANDPSLREPGLDEVRAELRPNAAAVDSELATLPMPAGIHKLFGPLSNPYYTGTNAAALSPTNGILLVTRLDGPTAEIAKALVDKAIDAETNGLWGRAYFDIRGITDTNYGIGDSWIRSAYEICRVMGYESYLDTNAATIPASFPMSHIAFYAGWYEPNPCGPFLAAKMEFMPGAFAYHLHSSSAPTLRSTNQFWTGPLLAKGASCSMGSVNEPYLLGTPDIGTFAARWLISGFTYGEAAYAAQSTLSWQTTVVGDPLYRPTLMNPQLLHLKLDRARNPLAAWSHLRIVNMNMVRGMPLMPLVNYLESLELTKQSPVLMEKLGDLNAAVGKPASSIRAYENALGLDPSPQQRIRLLLRMGDSLAAQGRGAEASETWRRLLKECPDYPGKSEVADRLRQLDYRSSSPAGSNDVKESLRGMQASPATNGIKE